MVVRFKRVPRHDLLELEHEVEDELLELGVDDHYKKADAIEVNDEEAVYG